MLKRFNIVLLISIIMMFSLSSVVMAADNLPDVEGDMTEEKIEEAVMMGYLAYIHNAVKKEDIKGFLGKLQNKSNERLSDYYGVAKYKTEDPFLNVVLSEMDKTLNDKYKIFSLLIQNQSSLKMKLNAGITKIIAIDKNGMQHEAYNYFDTEIPSQFKDNMFSDNNIYPGATAGFFVVFPYFDSDFKTIYIDSIIYEDNHREEVKIENLY